jgi:hypothetical protein
MRNAFFGWVIYCAFAATLGCQGASPEWNGTWKVNPSRSSFQGPVFTISISADGEYRWDNGTSDFTFRCDAKDQPIKMNRTQSCVKSNPTALDLIQKENGVKTSVNHWELSDGGKVLTSTSTALHSTGPVTAAQVVALRVSGSDGFAGEWRDTGYTQRHPDMNLKLDADHVLHIAFPSASQYVDAPLDGADAVLHGPRVPEGITYAAKMITQRQFLTLKKQNGKVYTQGALDLSSDGRVITETWWDPGRPSGKVTLVYEKE